MPSISFRELSDNVLGENQYTVDLTEDLCLHVYSFYDLSEWDAVNISTSERPSRLSVGFGSAFNHESNICINLASARILALNHEEMLKVERSFDKDQTK